VVEAVATAVVSDAPAAVTAEASGPHQSIRIEGAQPVNIIHLSPVSGEEPSAADLAAIEAEMPLIEAEQALLDAEIAALSTGPALSELARRRVRNAERRVAQVGRELAATKPESEDVA